MRLKRAARKEGTSPSKKKKNHKTMKWKKKNPVGISILSSFHLSLLSSFLSSFLFSLPFLLLTPPFPLFHLFSLSSPAFALLPSPFLHFFSFFFFLSLLCCRSAVSPSNTVVSCLKCSWEPYQLVLLQMLITVGWLRLYLPERLSVSPPRSGCCLSCCQNCSW